LCRTAELFLLEFLFLFLVLSVNSVLSLGFDFIGIHPCASVVSFPGMADRKLIYLSLGSNLGDRAANLQRAVELLSGVRILRRSSVYETEPVDVLEQPWFLNCVVEAETWLAPRQLLEELQTIERALGSSKPIRRGPRIIDVDILFCGSEVVREPGLEIPHPRLTERRFVLVPLVEVAPDLRHPVLHRTAMELLRATPDQSEVRIWRPLQGAAGS
jgi:2-amino-4-hydroxy-6-hydroxymethyldihydropteridine diphosphokinase